MNRDLYPSQSFGLGRVYCEFELLGAGAAALTLSTGAGQALGASATITRSSTGVFVITLKDPYNKVVFKSADVDDTLNDGAYATLGTVTNEGTLLPLQFTLNFRAAAGTLADPAVGRKIGISLALRNTASTGGVSNP